MKKITKSKPKPKTISKTTSKNNKEKKVNRFLNKNTILIALMFAAIFAVGSVIIFTIYVIATAPKFAAEELYNKESTILYDKAGKEFASLGAENRELVTYEELPQVLIDAIVATEDSRFFQHGGFDLPRFMKATVLQIFGNSAAGGASTLTMQVSKNTFTDAKQVSGLSGLVRKFTDIYLAVFQIERKYTKEEIIEFYVNAPWLATRSYGVEQACQTLFGKSVSDINLAEASLIAGLFQSPVSYNPFSNPELAAKRRNTVLTLMVKHGYITEEEKEIAGSITVESMLVNQKDYQSNPYQGFIDTVVEDVMDKTQLNPYLVPMLIYTTMDSSSQEVVNDLMQGKLYKFVNDKVQAAIAITDVKDGSITAIGNGRNKTGELEYNLATKMKRHPGSTAKPFFDYGPNIEFNNGSTYSPFFDEEMTYSDGTKLKNSDGSYLGLMTSRIALAKSRNIPAVQAFQQNDKKNIAEFVHSLGIDYGKDLFESAAIGGFDGMSPLEMSAAYAAFGRDGYYIEPYAFTKIVYRQSGDIYEHKPQKIKVMSEATAYLMNYMLTYAGSQGVGGKITTKNADIAAKTGTSTYDSATLAKYNYPSSTSRDNWSSIYTPDYSMTVWYGYEYVQDGYTTALAGDSARKSISAAVGNKIFKSGSRFNVPKGDVVKKVEVELETFPPMLPSEATPADLRTTEYFKTGTEPTDISPRFDTLANPTNGSWNANGSSITLSWEAIATPEPISTTYLQQHFDTYYKQWSSKYLQKRISYNNNYIGTNGYQVYLKSSDGTLTNLGFTTNSFYNYNITGDAGQYTFVVKSSYSIFKNNMSSGLEIDAYSTGSSGNNDTPDSVGFISSFELRGEATITICTSPTSGQYQDMANPVVVYSGNTDVTSLSTIEKRYYQIQGTNSTELNYINTAVPGEYRITYRATYGTDSRNASRKVIINRC